MLSDFGGDKSSKEEVIKFNELSSDPSVDSNHIQVYAKDGEVKKMDKQGNVTSVGSGGIGDPSIIYSEDFDKTAVTSLYTITGAGTLEVEVESVENPIKWAKFTQVAGSLNTTIEHTNGILLERRALQRSISALKDFEYSGNNGDIKIYILESSDDMTYSVAGGLNFGLELQKTIYTSLGQFGFTFKGTTKYFKLKIEVKTENINAVLKWKGFRLSLATDKAIALVNKLPTCKVSQNDSNASITTGITTYIGFDVEDFDEIDAIVNVGSPNTATYTNTTRYIVQKNGRYTVKAQLYTVDTDLDAEEQISIEIHKNGTAVSRRIGQAVATNAGVRFSLNIDDDLDFVEGDAISIAMYHEATGDISLNTTSFASWFTVEHQAEVSERVVFKGENKIKYAESVAFWGFGQRDGSNRVRLANKEAESTDNELISGDLGSGSTATKATLLKDCMIGAGVNGASSGDVGINIYASNGTLRYRVAESTGIRAGVPLFYPGKAGDYVMMTATSDLDNNDLTSFSVVAILAEVDPSALLAIDSTDIQHQTKNLTADKNTDGVVTDLTFNNLEIGRTYSIGGQLMGNAVNDDSWNINIYNDSTFTAQNTVGVVKRNPDGAGTAEYSEFATRSFVAQDTVLYFSLSSMSGNNNTVLLGNNTRAETYVTLTEYPTGRETNKFD